MPTTPGLSSAWKTQSCEHTRCARRCSLRVSARSSGHYERVLRYPNGQERRLIYPGREADAHAADAVTSFEEGCDPERWGEAAMSCDFQDAAAVMPARAPAPARDPGSLPSSPGELLRHLASEEHKAEQRAFNRLVASSYEVLDGSPWVQSKPVYVLAASTREAPDGLTFTLRTRVARARLESELSKARAAHVTQNMVEVLGRTQPNGDSLIAVSAVVDGIVTFEEHSDAERFAALLEADGVDEVVVAQVDAHELFRAAASAAGVVVLVRQVVLPDALGAALRNDKALDDAG